VREVTINSSRDCSMDTMAGKAKMREISIVGTKLLTVIVKPPLIPKA
jgi:hypothetical protein